MVGNSQQYRLECSTVVWKKQLENFPGVVNWSKIRSPSLPLSLASSLTTSHFQTIGLFSILYVEAVSVSIR